MKNKKYFEFAFRKFVLSKILRKCLAFEEGGDLITLKGKFLKKTKNFKEFSKFFFKSQTLTTFISFSRNLLK